VRILHVLEKHRQATGSVVQMMAAAAGQARRGHEVAVASRAGGELEEPCAESGVRFVPSRLRHGLDVASAVRLRPELRRADIVHVHKGRAHGVALLGAIGLGHRPALVVNRGVLFPLDAFNRWKYRHPRVAAVVCVADAVREVVIRTAGVPPERAVTVHAGTDVERFSPHAADRDRVRRELGLEADHLLVGTVSGRDWKGWRETAEAVAAAARPQLHLVVVGCESETSRASILGATRPLLGDRVTVLGVRHDMPDVLAACDVVVDASWTGTGITGTIREAMALERAVVATDCGGNSELVLHDECGLLVPPRDLAALTAAITRLAPDPLLRARLGHSARHRVVSEFSLERRLDRLESVYLRALGTPPDATRRP